MDVSWLLSSLDKYSLSLMIFLRPQMKCINFQFFSFNIQENPKLEEAKSRELTKAVAILPFPIIHQPQGQEWLQSFEYVTKGAILYPLLWVVHLYHLYRCCAWYQKVSNPGGKPLWLAISALEGT